MLFATGTGTRMYRAEVRALLRRLGRAAGLPEDLAAGLSPHSMPHALATLNQRAGVPVSQISKLLGQSSIAVTSRYLDHLSNAAAIEALEAVELPALDV